VKKIAPNRIAVYAVAVAGLLTAIAPLVADLDTQSTATLIAGLFAIVAAAVKWLSGWQNLEKSEAQDLVHRRATDRQLAAERELRESAAKQPRYGGSGIKLPPR
jgi:hypothetical protein